MWEGPVMQNHMLLLPSYMGIDKSCSSYVYGMQRTSLVLFCVPLLTELYMGMGLERWLSV